MLAWGWRVARTREGDSMALYSRTRRISQTSQVGPARSPRRRFRHFQSCISFSRFPKQINKNS